MTAVILFVHVLIAVCSPKTGDLATGAHRTAPSYLDDVEALEHATDAMIAGGMFDVSPALLLSIAHHESRYDFTTRTPERGGKVSCGVMTPVPKARCTWATTSLLAGYLAGAQHLREWIDASRGNLHVALVGYVGGYRLLDRCKLGPVILHRGKRTKDVCHEDRVFLGRAAWILRSGGAAS